MILSALEATRLFCFAFLFCAFFDFFMLNFHSIETFGTHEGPGIRLVLFLQGCNFACAYCHNPDTINFKGGNKISTKAILDLLKENRPYFSSGGGLTVSGGEPGLQAKELLNLFKQAKKKNFHTALDTNASLDTKEYKELLLLADLPLIDLKHIDDASHKKITGLSNKNVLKNILLREKSGGKFWLRYVLVPGLSDNPEHLRALGEFCAKLTKLERLEILPYHNLGTYKYKELGLKNKLEGISPPKKAVVLEAQKILKSYLPQVVIRK